MAAPNVDIVLVVDTSDSMKNCFDQLRMHLDSLFTPMQGNVSKVRYAIVGGSASSADGGIGYRIEFLHGPWDYTLYSQNPNDGDPRSKFFTEDPARIKQVLNSLVPSGDEDMLLTLDVAADLPFGPVSNTKRVIALFSDEKFETGVSGASSNRHIPALREKLMARHIQLFAAIPEGDGANQLAETDRSEIEFIDGGAGLKNVDFSRLLGQMGKSVSGSSLQATTEPTYQKALFGQDKWVEISGWSSTDGG
jgi:hypothetical protein